MPKTNTRNNKSLTAAKKEAAAAPVPELSTAEQPTEEQAAPESQTPTSQKPAKTSVIPLIATARVKNAVNDDLLNCAGNIIAAEVKSSLLKFSPDETSDEKTLLESKKNALSKCKIRFSSKSATHLAGACTVLAKSLIVTALTQAKLHDVKTVNVKHLYASDLRKHEMYPLIVGLPSFEAQLREYELQEAQKKLDGYVSNIRARAEKEFCKKYGVKKLVVEGDKQSEKPSQPKAQSPAEPQAEEDVSFIYYIVAICASVKNDDASMRTSKKFQKHISDIVLEFARRTAVHASRLTTHMNNKTINESTILESVVMKYIENVPFKDSFSFSQASATTESGVIVEHTVATKQTTYIGRDVNALLASIESTVAEYRHKVTVAKPAEEQS
jgi:histone H3/H4